MRGKAAEGATYVLPSSQTGMPDALRVLRINRGCCDRRAARTVGDTGMKSNWRRSCVYGDDSTLDPRTEYNGTDLVVSLTRLSEVNSLALPRCVRYARLNSDPSSVLVLRRHYYMSTASLHFGAR